jgi:glycosyltransferase involved in cell wall biosynthesis
MPDVRRSLRRRLGNAARRYVGQCARLAPGPLLHIIKAGLDAEVQRRTNSSKEHEVQRSPNSSPADTLSDGELIVRFAEVLLHGRGANSEDVENWKEFLGEDAVKREAMLREALVAYLAKPKSDSEPIHSPHRVNILGTARFLHLDDWQKLAGDLDTTGPKASEGTDLAAGSFRHSGKFTISAIASLYKSGNFIENFLNNITSQTIFDRCELIIIDANSPDNEAKIIDKYRKTFPNIIYKRMNHKIGVYEAWNLGIEMSKGKFITNTNLDDLRKNNSFELQASTLEKHDFVDVVYQDFFYTMDSRLTFDEVASIGIKSDLPIVTPHNLLVFNSPHNAPMWRRELHNELGLFDTTFESAGDWEFWLRCISKNKIFFKINEPHVAYFQNPEGVSTRPTTKGVQEGLRVWQRHSHKLVSPLLRLSREEFSNLLGGETDWTEEPSYYGAVQRRLDQLGQAFRAETAHHQGGRS